MRNFIKYSSWTLRKHEGLCVPRGPSFASASEVKINVLGNILKFRAPRHTPTSTESIEEQKVVSGRYELEGRNHSDREMPSQSWLAADIFGRKWAFYGPWFTGLMGTVSCHVSGIYTATPNKQVNFLNPQAFETAVLGFITAAWGHELCDRGIPYYQGPLDWLPLKQLPVPAVTLTVKPTKIPTYINKHVFFPVSRDKIACFTFSYLQNCAASQAEVDEKISPKPMQELIDNIIDSIQLTLSPECQQAVNEIRKSCPDLSVSPDCAPLNWPAHVDKDGLTIIDYDERLYAEA